uniref:CSON002709 protein n=1 Tax=Culicoides sonorensis TaxID=179676 RepID=A0A336ML13_CULSO
MEKSLTEYSEGDNVHNYLERFETFCEIHGVVDDLEMTKHLLVYGGPLLFEKIKILSHPKVPAKVKYSEIKPKIIQILKDNCPYNIQRSKFYSRVQNSGESVSEYAFELKRLASFCAFDTHLDVILRDRFIFNLRDDVIRERTIKSDKNSFEDAVSEALLHESTLKNSNVHSSIHKFNYSLNKSENKSQRYNKNNFKNNYHVNYKRTNTYTNNRDCAYCARKNGHGARTCPAIEKRWKCYICNKIGHTSKVCRLRNKNYNHVNNNAISESDQNIEQYRLASVCVKPDHQKSNGSPIHTNNSAPMGDLSDFIAKIDDSLGDMQVDTEPESESKPVPNRGPSVGSPTVG